MIQFIITINVWLSMTIYFMTDYLSMTFIKDWKIQIIEELILLISTYLELYYTNKENNQIVEKCIFDTWKAQK